MEFNMPNSNVVVIKNSEFPQKDPTPEREVDELEKNLFRTLERAYHAWLGKFTGGVSPATFKLAFKDWFEHMQLSPGKQMELFVSAGERTLRLYEYIAKALADKATTPCIEPDAIDRRFKSDEWKEFPFNVYSQTFLLTLDWWTEATQDVRGVNQHHLDLVTFSTRQMLDMIAPSNFIPTNPILIKTTIQQKGRNLFSGYLNLMEDIYRAMYNKKPVGLEKFQVGENIAVTEGQVIYKNDLLELIQYTPTTKKVFAEPIFIIPAWIMKYYILDLSQYNSLVKYLVDNGHTVFMISWKNPTKEYRNVGLNDYLKIGVLESINVINDIIPEQKIHAVGYCLGGTLLSIAASLLSRSEKNPIKSTTFFCAQTDFEEPGELQLFVDESQLSFLEDVMWEQGYLDKQQMKGMFQWLRSSELIWSNMVSNYLLGDRALQNDLMAWNADATRMPYKMHSEYLRKLFLRNELSRGKYTVDNKVVLLSNIDMPIFSVSTKSDHIAPWKSVYKIHLLTHTDITFVLTSGGHNAGIVSEPGHHNRTFQIKTTRRSDNYITPEAWEEETPSVDGSWWSAWQDWLVKLSAKDKIAPPKMGSSKFPPLGEAPGTYVYEE
jgi:polyhydroxyalkanoate synthase